jgi:hypothetical protein
LKTDETLLLGEAVIEELQIAGEKVKPVQSGGPGQMNGGN